MGLVHRVTTEKYCAAALQKEMPQWKLTGFPIRDVSHTKKHLKGCIYLFPTALCALLMGVRSRPFVLQLQSN